MKSLLKTLSAAIGAREVALLVGLGLTAYGASLVWWPATFVIPGTVLLYVSIAGLH